MMASGNTFTTKANSSGIDMDMDIQVEQQDEIYRDKTRGTAEGIASQKRHPKTKSLRRIFSFTQLAAFAITFMSSWEVLAFNMGGAFYNGGSLVLFWGLLITCIGALAQSLSLAELASIWPIAGAQYHWIDLLASPRYRRFITWMQGWVTWFAWVSVLSGVTSGTANLLLGLVVTIYPDTYTAAPWHITVLIIAQLLVVGLINAYAFRCLPWLEVIAGVLHVALWVIFMVVIIANGQRNNAQFVFLDSRVTSGWDNKFVSWNVGLLVPVWGYVGFDGAVHMSEETRKAKKAVPRVMVWSIITNSVMALAFVVAFLFCMDNSPAVLDSTWPVIPVLMSTAGTVGGTAMISGLIVVSMFVLAASLASVSRITWSWARDGALPAWFARVDHRHHVPIRALLPPIVIVSLLSLFVVGNTATVTVFSAFTALSTLGLYTSYIIAISCIIYARLTGRLGTEPACPVQYGDWRLPKGTATPINIFALVWSVYVTIWLPFPSTIPVTGANMNYAGPIYAAVVIGALVYWFAWGREHWPGLNRSSIAVIVAHD